MQQSSDFAGPLTPVLATLREDGSEIYLVIANGSWTRAVPCRVHLRDFPLGQANGVVLTSDNLDGKPLLENKQEAIADFPLSTTDREATCTIPPHAILFITLKTK